MATTTAPAVPLTSAECAIRAERHLDAAQRADDPMIGRRDPDTARRHREDAAIWADLANAAARREQTTALRGTAS